MKQIKTTFLEGESPTLSHTPAAYKFHTKLKLLANNNKTVFSLHNYFLMVPIKCASRNYISLFIQVIIFTTSCP